MADKKIDKKEAEKIVRRMRGLLPVTVSSDYVYIKLFKNMPRSDVEMIFPNTKVRFRLFDKIKFGVTAGGGVGMGVVGTASKSPHAFTTKVHSVRVKLDRKVPYELDGGDRKKVRKLRIEIEPAAVTVCVPA